MADQDWTPREKRLMAAWKRDLAAMAESLRGAEWFPNQMRHSAQDLESEASPREKPEAVDGALFYETGPVQSLLGGGQGRALADAGFTLADVRRLAADAKVNLSLFRNMGDPGSAECVEKALKPFLPLRDWFAGMALQGMASALADAPPDNTVASIAYRLADAMLSERTKPNE